MLDALFSLYSLTCQIRRTDGERGIKIQSASNLWFLPANNLPEKSFPGAEMPVEFIRLTYVRRREQQAIATGLSVCLELAGESPPQGSLGGLTQADLLLMK